MKIIYKFQEALNIIFIYADHLKHDWLFHKLLHASQKLFLKVSLFHKIEHSNYKVLKISIAQGNKILMNWS